MITNRVTGQDALNRLTRSVVSGHLLPSRMKRLGPERLRVSDS